MIAKYPDTLSLLSNGYVEFGGDVGNIANSNGDYMKGTDQIDPNETYEVQ